MDMKTEMMEAAEKAAKQICGYGACYAPYNCGHRNKEGVLSGQATDAVCPLAKYNVEPDTRTFKEVVEDGIPIVPVTSVDIFAVCACCEHSGGYSEISENGQQYMQLNRTEDIFLDHCLSCPVQMAYDAIIEGEAEAGMS